MAREMNVFRSMDDRRLETIVAAFERCSVAVVGDFFLDKYLDVDPSLAETSVETGKVAHQVVRVRHSPGAAGTVTANLAALGAGRLYALGFTGDDGEAYDLRAGLTNLGCNVEHMHVDSSVRTPTYLKPRNAAVPGLEGEHSRYDTKNRVPVPEHLLNRIVTSLATVASQVDAVIVMDQVEEPGCGACGPAIVKAIGELAERHRNVVFWADSRRRVRTFRNVFTKPNEFEILGIQFPEPGRIVDIAVLEREIPALTKTTGAPVFVTIGPRGMIVSHPEPTLVPGVRVDGPVDTTGAGDSATAGCVLALAAGATEPEAALIGNLAASVTVQQLAVTGTASPGQLKSQLTLWRRQREEER